jgi:transcriptional regulator with XRE-family HTH domain
MPSPASAPDPALAAVVRKLRSERGLAMEALAARAGVTLNTISRLELAQSDPSWSTVRQVAAALGVSLAEFGEAVEATARVKP